MLKLSPSAAMTLGQEMRRQQVPESYGVRISGRKTPDGEVGLEISFAEEPATTDSVGEQHGTKLFVAQEVADPLASFALDVNAEPTEDSSTPAQLVIRPQEPTDG